MGGEERDLIRARHGGLLLRPRVGGGQREGLEVVHAAGQLRGEFPGAGLVVESVEDGLAEMLRELERGGVIALERKLVEHLLVITVAEHVARGVVDPAVVLGLVEAWEKNGGGRGLVAAGKTPRGDERLGHGDEAGLELRGEAALRGKCFQLLTDVGLADFLNDLRRIGQRAGCDCRLLFRQRDLEALPVEDHRAVALLGQKPAVVGHGRAMGPRVDVGDLDPLRIRRHGRVDAVGNLLDERAQGRREGFLRLEDADLHVAEQAGGLGRCLAHRGAVGIFEKADLRQDGGELALSRFLDRADEDFLVGMRLRDDRAERRAGVG